MRILALPLFIIAVAASAQNTPSAPVPVPAALTAPGELHLLVPRRRAQRPRSSDPHHRRHRRLGPPFGANNLQGYLHL